MTNSRIRLDPLEAARAGQKDAERLIGSLLSLQVGDVLTETESAGPLFDSLAEIIGLAVENRLDECEARARAFCRVIGPRVRSGAALLADVAERRAAERPLPIATVIALLAGNCHCHIVESEGGEA